ncbi:hypothetical protein INH39_22900 [Massilia violaceinigra]|uniref:MatE family transporter n=1 Tax=Massilia violaceinigra TaxID=2045208 RepID=A0ABY4A2L2_9BURK|nr:hypothetical protein [Massilia violaceinigra]UOD28284.1 hypothetical protein INH39_22900 [Massilia violaceinigra]
MHATSSFPDPAQAKSLVDEADIGSGEKPPSQLETEEMIRQIPPLPPSDPNEADNDSDNENDTSAAGQFDGGENRDKREHDASLERDEPSEQLDQLDPVPPKGQ